MIPGIRFILLQQSEKKKVMDFKNGAKILMLVEIEWWTYGSSFATFPLFLNKVWNFL